MNNKSLHMLTYILVIVGALNWGLMGFFNLNLVNMLLGGYPMLEKLVYMLVGLSAVYEFMMHKANCKLCGK